MQNNQKFTSTETENEGLNLLALFNTIYYRKFFILTIVLVSFLLSITYINLVTPIYQATAMIQVEDGASSIPGFDNIGGIFDDTSKSTTEIELIKSRRVIGEAVDSLQLDILVKPRLLPLVGGRIYRNFVPLHSNDVSDKKYGLNRYAWGGESIDVFRFDIPDAMIGKKLIIRYEENQRIILLYNNNILAEGLVGEDIISSPYAISIRSVKAKPGTEFIIQRKSRFQKIIELQREISAFEKIRDSGIISMSYKNPNPDIASKVLNRLADIYVRQNVERNSAEAQKSLNFLKIQLPEIKKQLEFAENKFNDYQIRRKSIDITLETQAILEQIVELETKVQELELSRLEMSRRFKQKHPIYQGLVEQINLVKEQKENLSNRVTKLPETQQELLRYTRDVKVSNEIYTMLLSKVQELDIIRAGTVGNARIVDIAEVNLGQPVYPKKLRIILFFILGGTTLSCLIILIQEFFNRSIEDPSEIEAMGIPLYATVPYSYQLAQINKNRKSFSEECLLISVKYPDDLAVESLRSLRTSLHFALLESKNNIISISGPSPNIGKSFIVSNLGVVIAQANKRVLIIDADLRRGDLANYILHEKKEGLSEYLSGQQNLKDVVFPTTVKGLDIITRGIVPPNPSELLMHDRFSNLIKYAEENYDLVLIDTPPILAVTDAAIISSHAGSTLIVARFGETHKKELELTLSRFTQNGINPRGIIFNGIKKVLARGYNHYNYYNYEYSSEDNK